MIKLYQVEIHNLPNSVNQELIIGGNIHQDCPDPQKALLQPFF